MASSDRWHNCIALTRRMNFVVFHIFREGNTCADKLGSHGLALHGFLWWESVDSVPPFVREDFFRNRFNLPSYRLC